MEKFIVRWAANAVGLFFAANLPDVFHLSFREGTADFMQVVPVPAVIIIAALILALVNTFVRPLVKMFTCLISLVTMGLFSIVINIAMVFLTSMITKELLKAEFVTFPEGVLAAFTAALIIGIINAIFNRVF